jgi:hypothetical protein
MCRFVTARWSRLVLVGVLLGAAALAGFASTRTSGPAAGTVSDPDDRAVGTVFSYHELAGRSEREIGQYAIGLAQARGLAVVGSKAEVALVQPIQRDGFEAVGLPYVSVPDPEPPMALVILRGAFVLRPSLVDPTIPVPPASYLLLVIELPDGAPILWTGSTKGGSFRHLLHDPSLPDDGLPRVAPPPADLQPQFPTIPRPTPRYLPQPVVDRGAPSLSAVQTAGPLIPPGYGYSLTPLRPIP